MSPRRFTKTTTAAAATTAPPSLQTRVGGAVFLMPRHPWWQQQQQQQPHPRYKCELVGLYSLCHVTPTHINGTPPSLQARVGGVFFMYYFNSSPTLTTNVSRWGCILYATSPHTPPSHQTRVGGVYSFLYSFLYYNNPITGSRRISSPPPHICSKLLLNIY